MLFLDFLSVLDDDAVVAGRGGCTVQRVCTRIRTCGVPALVAYMADACRI